MRIALLGYGKMGKVIESLALDRKIEVGPVLDIDNNRDGQGLTAQALEGADVAIDFSTPESVLSNVRRLMELRVPTVVGTTGWNDHRDEVRRWVEHHHGALVYSPNFSVGVQLFFRLVRRAAELFASQKGYRPYLFEAHHEQKKDAPSGTARELEKILRSKYAEVPVSSLRVGFIPGTHEVGWDSLFDTVTLVHRARDRRMFAEGALLAAQWVIGRQGFFSFEEVLEQIHGK